MNTNNSWAHGRPRKFFLMPLFFIGAAAAMGALVMLLWNAIVPGLTGWAMITFWKSLGLIALCRLLFGGIRGRGGWKGGRGLKHRWSHMSEEEKMKFREQWRGRCNWGPTHGEEKVPQV